jgi:hypothetical protein
MGRYALIITASGLVDNVIEYDGSAPFTPPTGQELRLATANAEPGGTWNGSAFVRAPTVAPTRTQILMNEVRTTRIYDASLVDATIDADGEVTHDGMRDKTVSEVAAEKLELRNLLTASLVGGADLGQVETQTLLRLERE